MENLGDLPAFIPGEQEKRGTKRRTRDEVPFATASSESKIRKVSQATTTLSAKQFSELDQAFREQGSQKVDQLLSSLGYSLTASMVHEALSHKLHAIASQILKHPQFSQSEDEWIQLVDEANKHKDNSLLITLLEKKPSHAVEKLFNKYEKHGNESFCIYLTKLILSFPEKQLSNLSFFDSEVACLLRYSIQISPEATLYLIDHAPLSCLSSPEARDFLFGCIARAKQGQTEVLKALIAKGVDFQSLYKQEAHLSAEKGQALQGVHKMLETHRSTMEPVEATFGESDQTVILVPKHGVVLKHRTEKAKEDEDRAMNLFHLAKPGGVLTSVTLSDISDVVFAMDEDVQPLPEELQNVEAKPFATGMKSVSELQSSPVLLHEAFERLDTNAKTNALLLSELQFLDLHGTNLALRVSRTRTNEALLNTSYLVETPRKGKARNSPELKTFNFDDLVEAFIEKKIHKETIISYTIDGVKKKDRLGNLPEIFQALQGARYELVIFDTDINFAETNGVHIAEIEEYERKHLIPFRSCLLEVDFKDKEVPQEAIVQLRRHSQRMVDWLWSSSSPFYGFMSKEDKRQVMKMTRKLVSLPRYSLSNLSANNEPDCTVAKIRRDFSHDCAYIDSSQKSAFWQKVQESLAKHQYFKPYVIQEGVTLESLANQLQVDQALLQDLNPDVNFDELQPGENLITKPYLLSDEGYPLRVKIASSLFPKATFFQIRAFEERLNARETYLKCVDALQQLRAHQLRTQDEFAHALGGLQFILSTPSIPISTFEKMKIKEGIKRVAGANDSSGLNQLLSYVAEKIKPTYFNFMKAMYPLLADTWEALLVLNPDEAGISIGTSFLEDIIDEMNDIAMDEEMEMKQKILKQHLDEEINRSAIKDAAGSTIWESRKI